MQSLSRALIVCLLLVCSLLVCADRLRAQVDFKAAGEDHIAIRINGQPFSDLYVGRSYAKPFLAPLRSATGLIVTRRFPQEQVEGESRDHPHHRGLWIGYGDINHINFWENDPASNPSGDNPKEKGFVRLKQLGELKPGKKSGSISLVLSWQTAQGVEVLREQRTFTFYADKKDRRLDIDSSFTAEQAANFADTKEGFFAIRVADSMSGKNGGILTNSDGAQTEKDVWGKHADWVDYDGTVDEQKVGIVILDNPHNLNHPPRWHARDYGLFAVNPFGVRDFDPKASTRGGFQMKAGATLRFRYRVIIHNGDEPKKTLARWYADYVKAAQ